MSISRRKFFADAVISSAVVSFGASVPSFLLDAASASEGDAAQAGSRESVLVVLQLSGGNDGLNTVVPYHDPAYRAARPKLAIPAANVLKINDRIGFHPAARGLADLLESGRLAIVQGVGYPEPNRSHFESMDIWHTCQRKDHARSTGWLGRYFDAAYRQAAESPGLFLGADKQPMALTGAHVRVTSINSPESFRLKLGNSREVLPAIRDLTQSSRQTSDELFDFLKSSTSTAISASERIAAVMRDYRTSVSYPDHELGRRFKTIAQLVSADLPIRVYYLALDGFDTHSQQPDAHAALLQQWGGAVKAFLDDLAGQGHADRVAVMCFSEFGRRVAENASDGTDHGAAGPMFVAGTRVRGGVIGEHPSLAKLDNGDLIHHTDFRQVYAAALEQWLKFRGDDLLGGRFQPVPLFVG